jgi:hypothetical protein
VRLRILEKLVELLGVVAVLGGCSAMLLAPVTSPIWIIVGLFFLADPRLRW